MAVFPTEQTMRTHSYYRAAYADYAALLGNSRIYASQLVSTCCFLRHNMQTTQTMRMRLFYVTTRNYAATMPCRPKAARAIFLNQFHHIPYILLKKAAQLEGQGPSRWVSNPHDPHHNPAIHIINLPNKSPLPSKCPGGSADHPCKMTQSYETEEPQTL